MKQLIEKAIFCLCVTAICLSVSAQALPIGQQCPDFAFNNLTGERQGHYSLSDFKGKIVILDFFSTTCLPCIRGLKALDSLQDAFKDQLIIVSVTAEPKWKVEAFFKRRKESHNRIMVTGDTLLGRWFPHQVVPHFAWIDKDGKVLATTSNESVTPANIEKLVKGEKASFVLKQDIMNFDGSKPFEPDSNILCRFVIDHYKPGLNGSGLTSYKTSHVKNRMMARNNAVAWMYGLAFNLPYVRDWFILIQSKDSDRLRPPRGEVSERWKQENFYAFDLIVDSSKARFMNQIMIHALDDYFNLETEKIYLDTPCLVLKRIPGGAAYRTKGGRREAYFTDESDNYLPKYLHNMPLFPLINTMMNMDCNFYVMDETGIKGNVDLEFSAPLDDIEGLNKDLKKYDLRFVKERRKIPFVLIKDRLPR